MNVNIKQVATRMNKCLKYNKRLLFNDKKLLRLIIRRNVLLFIINTKRSNLISCSLNITRRRYVATSTLNTSSVRTSIFYVIV